MGRGNIYIFFSRKTMKSCPSGTTGCNGKKRPACGKHGFLTSSPASTSRTARSKRWGPLNTIEQLGSQLWLSKDILEKRKKRRILWLCRQKQTSKFNNYNGKRHFTLGAGGQVGLTVYQELSPLGALAYFPWSERLPGWKLIREAC